MKEMVQLEAGHEHSKSVNMTSLANALAWTYRRQSFWEQLNLEEDLNATLH
jgi:hypothetical protein